MANNLLLTFGYGLCAILFVAVNTVEAKRANHLACASVPDGIFVRSAKSCQHYHLCRGQRIATEMKCPHGFLFSDVKQMCDHAKLVNCDSCVTYGRPNSVDPNNCYSYFKCINGLRHKYYCSVGQMFDDTSNQCQATQNVDCKNSGFDVNDEVLPIDPNPGNGSPAEWPIDEKTTVGWGPPRAPSSGTNYHPQKPGGGPPGRKPITTKRPGGLGTWTPNPNPERPSTEYPWGPPDAPIRPEQR